MNDQLKNLPDKDDFHIKTKNINTLFQFIKNNKDEQFLEYISSLTQDEIDVNMKDENGNYLIYMAVMKNNKKIVKKLIELGSRLDILDTEGYSILYYPIKFNYFEMIDMLLEYNKNIVGISLVNIKDSHEYVPLFYAIKYRNKHALQELLVNNADVNYMNSDGITSLYLSILKKDPSMVRMLIKYVKNIDAKTITNSTALHVACNFQLFEIVKILLEYGANQNIMETEYNFYPIFYVVVQNNLEITKLLIDHDANPNHQDYMGNTIIHYAITLNHIAILDYIIENYNIDNKSILVYDENINDRINTSSKNNLNGNSLKTYSINPNIVNIDGLTIVHLMLYNYKDQYDKYINKLLIYVNINYQDNIGNTILHILTETNLWVKFDNILRNKKLNIYIKNNNGKTVMDMVQLREREYFIDMVAMSYYNYLQKYNNGWILEWQNKCSNSLNIKEECIKYIKDIILKEKTSVPEKKDKKNIIVDKNEIVNFSTFTGSLLDVIVGFKYLTKKYPYVSTILHSNMLLSNDLETYNKSIGIQENMHQHIIQFEIRWIYQKMFLPPNFEKILGSIINNKKYKFIIMPIGIILSNGNHSNALLYHIDTYVLERFEPHGSSYPTHFNYNPDLLDDIIYKKFNNILSNIYEKQIKIKYYQPKNYLPKIGFQIFENTEININRNIGDPNGFCSLWCIWYLDYRIRYIDIKINSFVNKLISEIKINNYSFRNTIRNYSKIITDLRDKYLDLIHKNINDYLNNRLDNQQLKKLLTEILTDDLDI